MKRCSKVGDCVTRNISFLRKLARTSSLKKKTELIKNATPDELSTLVEITFNVVNKAFHVTPSRRLMLEPYATPLRKLSKTRSVEKARKILQTGDGFPFASLLVPILLAAGQRILE